MEFDRAFVTLGRFAAYADPDDSNTSLMTAIDDVFAACRSENRLAFMPFLTAGDPDVAFTAAAIERLGAANVDLIEVGFPYSDPIADGPVIQASYTRALNHKIKVNEIFDALSGCGPTPPRIAMVSYAIIHRHGPDAFCEHARKAGVAGLIVPDLSGTDAGEMKQIADAHGLNLVQLVAPTTPRSRAEEIVKTCSGFVYCIAVAGVTGERQAVAEDLVKQLTWLREVTELPLAVGFGISKPEHVAPLKGMADGVIVGSGIVRRMESGDEAALNEVESFSREMVAACRA